MVHVVIIPVCYWALGWITCLIHQRVATYDSWKAVSLPIFLICLKGKQYGNVNQVLLLQVPFPKPATGLQ